MYGLQENIFFVEILVVLGHPYLLWYLVSICVYVYLWKHDIKIWSDLKIILSLSIHQLKYSYSLNVLLKLSEASFIA